MNGKFQKKVLVFQKTPAPSFCSLILHFLDVPIARVGSITRFLAKFCFTSFSDVVCLTTSDRGGYLNDCAFLHSGAVILLCTYKFVHNILF